MNIAQTTAYWNKLADSLSKKRADILQGKDRIHWEKAFTMRLPKQPSLRILDVGSGTGFLSILLSQMGHQVIGIDISPVMVQCAYETASALGQRIEFRIMNLECMDFDPEEFDIVVCCEVLSHLENHRQAFIEINRVLKKEGYFILFDTRALTAIQIQAQGFTHCWMKEETRLTALQQHETIKCLGGRKPSAKDGSIPQITLFHKHIQTVKKQIHFYQNWCQSVGISYSDYTVLNMISHHSKGVRPSDICAALVLPPQTLTRILSGLQRADYILRKTSERDHRSAVITITDKGMEKIKPLQQTLGQIEETALSRFGVEELTRMNEQNDKILTALEQELQHTKQPLP